MSPEPELRCHGVLRSGAELPAGDDWLAPEERAILARLRVPKRRADWRVGRWAAKQALARCLRDLGVRPVLPEILVLPAPDGAPEVRVAGTALALGLSLSHSGGYGFAIACTRPLALGCDLEAVEPRPGGFVRDYFTPAEAATVAAASGADHGLLATLIWSAKESALKARRQGLRADTRSVEVSFTRAAPPGLSGTLELLCHEPEDRLRGRWWYAGDFVHTVAGPEALVAALSPDPPWQDDG